MRYQNVYSSKNVISLSVILGVVFWLLYSIGSFLHESKKVSDEIDAMKASNRAIEEEIEEKKQEYDYLLTPQRIEKEAKMQMGKKLPGEQVLVFIEERLDILPTELSVPQRSKVPTNVSIPEKWQWVFFGS